MLGIREMQVMNNTYYQLDDITEGEVKSKLYETIIRSEESLNLNETFLECVQLNQKMQTWLSITDGGKF